MAVGISVVAFTLSLFTFVYNRRTSRRDLLLKMHDSFLAPDRQEGRRLLFELTESGGSPGSLGQEEFRLINHALASFDVMGFLYMKRYIPRSDAVALWGITTTRALRAAESCGFMALRDSQNRRPIWPFFRKFVAAASVEGESAE